MLHPWSRKRISGANLLHRDVGQGLGTSINATARGDGLNLKAAEGRGLGAGVESVCVGWACVLVNVITLREHVRGRA